MAQNPLISIIIPVFNQKANIAALIAGVSSRIIQHSNLEVIIVDNGSEDGTLDVVSEYKWVKLLKNSQMKSPYVSRNIGIAESRGEYILFLDAKCRIKDENWINKIIDKLEKDSIYPIMFSAPVSKLTYSQWCEMIGLYYYNMLIKKGSLALGGGFVVHRKVFEETGMFDEYRSGGDIVWIQKALKNGYSIKKNSEHLVEYIPKKHKDYLRKKAREGLEERHLELKNGKQKFQYLMRKTLEMRPPNPLWIYSCLKEHGQQQKSAVWYMAVWLTMWYYRVYQKMIAIGAVQGESD